MNAPGFLSAAWSLARKDLLLERRTLETVSSSVIFSLIVLVLFQFAFGLDTVKALGSARLIPGVLWSVIAFASVVGMARSMQVERTHDTLAALFLAPVPRGALFVGKFLANLAKLLLLLLAVLPRSALLFDWNLIAVAGPLLVVIAAHVLGLTVLGTLFSAVAARLGRGEALVATLLFPASTPLFLSAVRCTGALLDGRPLSEVSSWLLIAVGFDLLYFFIALATFEFALED